MTNPHIAIIGLGYVGLPLAAAFSKQYTVLGFDANPDRIAELHRGHDRTHSLTADELASLSNLTLTSDPTQLSPCTVILSASPPPSMPTTAPILLPF